MGINKMKATNFFETLHESFFGENNTDTKIINNFLIIDSSKNEYRNSGKNFKATISVVENPLFAEHALKQWMGAVDYTEVEDFFTDLKNGVVNEFHSYLINPFLDMGKNGFGGFNGAAKVEQI